MCAIIFGSNMKKTGLVILAALVFISVIAFAKADLTSITFNTPVDNEAITGTYTLNTTLGINDSADNITFQWTNDGGTTWNDIATVNGTTYDWDTTSMVEGWYRYALIAIAITIQIKQLM